MSDDLEKKLGYSFKDKSILESALHHSSVKKYALQFERLEFLGDRILGAVVAEYIFEKFSVKEGVMSKMMSAFVCADSCKRIALKLGLDKFLVAAGNQLHTNVTVLADTVEALIGAVFIDGGYDSAKIAILLCWSEIFKGYDEMDYDPKTKLQEVCQRKTGSPPLYSVISVTGDDHAPVFTVSASIGSETAVATGSSKKKAETLAAKLLLSKFSYLSLNGA
ncbi:MAG: ribonuclease III [Holosporales bacterium]|jgi:ribonuclease-3|nr:ribonuclease III [Holosporales bacterium]